MEQQHHETTETDQETEPLLQPTHSPDDNHGDPPAFNHRTSAAIAVFLTFLAECLMILTFIVGLFFIIPLTPDIALQSISTSAPSILNTTNFDHAPSCGYVYLDLWFNATARFTPVVFVKDKLQGHCREVKVQLCFSSSSSETATSTTVVHPFHGACEVHSEGVRKTRLVVLVMLILLGVIFLGINFLMFYFICSPYFES